MGSSFSFSHIFALLPLGSSRDSGFLWLPKVFAPFTHSPCPGSHRPRPWHNLHIPITIYPLCQQAGQKCTSTPWW